MHSRHLRLMPPMPVTLGNPRLALLPPGGREEGAQLGDCQSILLFCTTTTTTTSPAPQPGEMCFFLVADGIKPQRPLGNPCQEQLVDCPKGVSFSTEPATSMKKVAVVLARSVGDLLMEHWCLNAWPKWSPGWCSQVTASPTSTFQHK